MTVRDALNSALDVSLNPKYSSLACYLFSIYYPSFSLLGFLLLRTGW